MSRTKDLWMEQHEAAIERFVTGEDTLMEFAEALRKLGFDEHDIRQEVDNAYAERAEQAAYEAQSAYFKSITRSKP